MKNKISGIAFKLIMFLLMLFSIFSIVFSVGRVLYDYGLIETEHLYCLSICFSLVFSFGVMIYIQIGVKNAKRSYIRNLLYMELPNIALFCTFLIILMSSIDTKVKMSRTDAISIINISWTIFSISTTIFLVWNAIIVPYLKRHEPVESKRTLLFDKYKYIEEKGSFYVSTNRMYSSIVLLSANLMVLAFSTALLYAYNSEIVLLTQFLIKATLFLSLNSISVLFLNILIPINEEKKELLMHKRVVSTDIDTQNELLRKLDNAEIIFDKLENDSNLDDEIKLEIMRTLLKRIVDDNSRHDDSAK